LIVLYDGSLEGFLTMIYEVYYEKITPTKIIKTMPNELILDDMHTIKTDEFRSEKVLVGLKDKFTKNNFETILNIFLCDSVNFELDLLQFIILGFKSQKELANINHLYIFAIQTLQKELFRNLHKMYAFVRFVETDDGLLYAKLDSKFNLIHYIGKYFLKRFNNQNYIIHDIARKIAFVKMGDNYNILEVDSFSQPSLSKNEDKFATLWKTFFASISIETRENIKHQKQLVPLIYRTFMTEFE